MDSVKYIGMDVHKEAISIAVLNSAGKLVMECVIRPRPSPFWNLWKDCAGACMSLLKKGAWAALRMRSC